MDPKTLPDFDSMWDYSDPQGTEQKFRDVLARTEHADLGYRLQLRTQIGRTLGLQQKFDEAHAVLDEVERELEGLPESETETARIRYLLERGRVFRSSGKPDESKPYFEQAWNLGREAGADDYAVDAAHMLAIVESLEQSLEWFEKGCRVAEQSDDPKARGWLGPLYNNLGWTYHDAGKLESALEVFRKAEAWRAEQGQPRPLQIAKYSVARCLRSLERYDEALAIQTALLGELDASGQSDGYVHEEMGELLLALGREDEARPHFARAHELLSDDAWLQSNEKERLERLRSLGRVQ